MKTSYAIGTEAEASCCEFLKSQGYEVLATRFKTKFGEIDVIARKENLLAFIEVKARKRELGQDDIISKKQKKRIANTALLYLSKYPEYGDFEMSFDFIFIAPGQIPMHITSAWSLDDLE